MSGDGDDSLELSKVRDLVTKLSIVIKNENKESCNNEGESQSPTAGSSQLIQLLQNFQTQNQHINLNSIFALITPKLFNSYNMDVDGNHADTALSQSEALQTMIAVISSNPGKYNLAAIASILNYVKNRSNLVQGEFNLTHEFLETIVEQIQNPSTKIAHSASDILSLIASQLPSSPHQLEVISTILLLVYTNVEDNANQIMQGKKKNYNDLQKVDPSILFIRNMSLIIDILIPTAHTEISLHVSTLLSSLTSSNPLLSTFDSAIQSGDENVEPKTKSILDPIATLMNPNKQDSDPLLIMNLFEILEKISSSTNSMLQSWIEKNMTQILLSQLGFHFIDDSSGISGGSGSSTVLVQNGDIDPFNYIAAFTILSKCCASARSFTLTETEDEDQSPKALSSDMMVIIFQHILNNCIEESRDNSEKIRYIGAITNFITDEKHGDHDERLKLFLKETNVMKFWLNLKQGNSEYKVAVLKSIAHVLGCKEEGDGNDDAVKAKSLSNDMCTCMHNAIAYLNGETSAMQLYMAHMKSSIDEIRLAIYEIIKATIVNRRKNLGIAQIVGHDGFMDLLLTRNIEITKEGKDLKYDIVKGILASEMKGLLSLPIVKSMEKYVELGPYYIDTVSRDVLIE